MDNPTCHQDLVNIISKTGLTIKLDDPPVSFFAVMSTQGKNDCVVQKFKYSETGVFSEGLSSHMLMQTLVSQWYKSEGRIAHASYSKSTMDVVVMECVKNHGVILNGQDIEYRFWDRDTYKGTTSKLHRLPGDVNVHIYPDRPFIIADDPLTLATNIKRVKKYLTLEDNKVDLSISVLEAKKDSIQEALKALDG